MKPDIDSLDILNITRSKAKMFEYNVDFNDHIQLQIDKHPSRLFDISIGILGDLAFLINETPFEGEELYNLDNSTVQFSAQFFDSYLKARLNEEMNPYLLLVGAASYYLCDLPGSSLVLTNQLKKDEINLESRGLENLLHWILEGEFRSFSYISSTIFEKDLIEIYNSYIKFYKTGTDLSTLLKATDKLRMKSYEYGTARELLFADVICALTKKRLKNSVWFSLPKYSNLPS